MTTSSKPKSSWREVLPIHPAADLFPLISADEMKALGEDIKKNGLRDRARGVARAKAFPAASLIDGRNRLDAMEAVGISIRVKNVGTDADPQIALSMRSSPNEIWFPITVGELRGDVTRRETPTLSCSPPTFAAVTSPPNSGAS